MDPRTGHIVADINDVPEHRRSRYEQLRDELLIAEAREQLNGEREAYIDPQRAKNLAAWAANTRNKNRKRNKLAKASRARNR
jgi:hypothetical protein